MTPLGVGPLVRQALERASVVCYWCFDLNLLAGGFEAPRLEERWSPEELAELRVAAERLAVERGAPWRVRRQILQRREVEETQGVLA